MFFLIKILAIVVILFSDLNPLIKIAGVIFIMLYRVLSFISVILLIVGFLAYKWWGIEDKQDESDVVNPEIFFNLSENQLLQIKAAKITNISQKYLIESLKGWLIINNHKAIFLDANQAIWYNNQLMIDDFVKMTWSKFNFIGQNAIYNIKNSIVSIDDMEFFSDLYQAYSAKLQINLTNNNFILYKPKLKIVNINLYDKQ